MAAFMSMNKWITLSFLISFFQVIIGNNTTYEFGEDGRHLQMSMKTMKARKPYTSGRNRRGQESNSRSSKYNEQPDRSPDSPPPPIGHGSLLHHTTLVVIADVGSEDSLRAAQCTYMSTLDPYQIIYISDFSLPRPGGCNLPIIHSLRIPFATDYFDALRELYLSKIPLHPWVLIGK